MADGVHGGMMEILERLVLPNWCLRYMLVG